MPFKIFSFCHIRSFSNRRRLARIAAAALAACIAAPAFADNIDGTITKIDAAKNTVTLNNGKTYNLPGEVDYSGFHVGQKVSVFYDTDPSGSYITDIESQDGSDAAADGGEDDDTSAK